MERYSSGSKAAESGKCSVKARVVRPAAAAASGVLGDGAGCRGRNRRNGCLRVPWLFSLSTCGLGREVPYLNGLYYLSAVEEAEEVPCSNSIEVQGSLRVLALPNASMNCARHHLASSTAALTQMRHQRLHPTRCSYEYECLTSLVPSLMPSRRPLCRPRWCIFPWRCAGRCRTRRR